MFVPCVKALIFMSKPCRCDVIKLKIQLKRNQITVVMVEKWEIDWGGIVTAFK